MKKKIIITGAGPSGLIAAIFCALKGYKVVLLESMSEVGLKLLASGGGRCNLANTQSQGVFMEKFGRQGRFMRDAFEHFYSDELCAWMRELGVEVHAPDGMHVFPETHQAKTVLNALLTKCGELGVEIKTNAEVKNLNIENRRIVSLETSETLTGDVFLFCTGGKGYSQLGGSDSGYNLISQLGHKVTDLNPGMVPLITEEKWVDCRQHILGKVQAAIPLKKYKKIKETGDLIFTFEGLRGPIIQDLSTKISPLLKEMDKLPLLLNLTGKNFSSHDWEMELQKWRKSSGQLPIVDFVREYLPLEVAQQVINKAGLQPEQLFSGISGKQRVELLNTLGWTPFTVLRTEGWEKAMVTAGGVSLKEVDPKTMRSKLIDNLYFAGEVLDLAGPCGGYNLQWAFSSGYWAAANI